MANQTTNCLGSSNTDSNDDNTLQPTIMKTTTLPSWKQQEIPPAPEIYQDIDTSNPNHNVNIDKIISNCKLNAEQIHAFRIITKHSLENRPDQLWMYLGGPAGTGKSRVINALKEFFIKRGQSH
jgi:hypothetical protein